MKTNPIRMPIGAAPCASAPVCTKENGDGNYYAHSQPRGLRGCCMCPVVPRADGSYALSPNGTAHYRPPAFDPYGGTGVLLSKGLLNAIPADAWALCARRLVCGAADFRLSACVAHLLNGTRFVRMDDNHLFMGEALRTSIDVIDDRDELIAFLESCGIETREMMPLLSQPIYVERFGDILGQYPVAQNIEENGFFIGPSLFDNVKSGMESYH